MLVCYLVSLFSLRCYVVVVLLKIVKCIRSGYNGELLNPFSFGITTTPVILLIPTLLDAMTMLNTYSKHLVIDV